MTLNGELDVVSFIKVTKLQVLEHTKRLYNEGSYLKYEYFANNLKEHIWEEGPKPDDYTVYISKKKKKSFTAVYMIFSLNWVILGVFTLKFIHDRYFIMMTSSVGTSSLWLLVVALLVTVWAVADQCELEQGATSRTFLLMMSLWWKMIYRKINCKVKTMNII